MLSKSKGVRPQTRAANGEMMAIIYLGNSCDRMGAAASRTKIYTKTVVFLLVFFLDREYNGEVT